MWGTHLNPSVRWVQLALLGLLTSFVGAMWGLERTVVPLIAKRDFDISSATVALSFIMGFGLTKAFANLFAGGLMDRMGRKGVLVLGWAVGIPVPFLIIWAPGWGWVVAANALLGINQGLCWTATILMMMDIMGAQRRGLSTGLNEFLGYGGVALTTLASGFLAAAFAPRPHPFLLAVALAPLGFLISLTLVQETAHYPREEAAQRTGGARSPSFWNALAASLRDRSLFSASQGGLVTKINDAAVWGLVPLFLASQGLDVVRIGIVAALYPAVWGVGQFGTGFLSDHVGRKPLIVSGLLVQGLGIGLMGAGDSFPSWLTAAIVLGIGTAAVYPTLIAAVGDHAHPMRRASVIGIYRWYRDAGFVVGPLAAGLMTDALGFRPAFLIIAAISLCSSLAAGVLMRERTREGHLLHGSIDWR